MWISATGGPRRDFWALYLIVVVSVGLRFGWLETIGAAIGLAFLYAPVLIGGEGADGAMLYRFALLVLTGVAVGVLTHHLTLQRRERHARSEYVAIVAHELRTPLASILGVLATLKNHGSAFEARSGTS